MDSIALAATSRLFSSSLMQEFATRGRSPTFARLLEQSDLTMKLKSSASVKDVFELAFNTLKKTEYRNEYSYKAALIQKVLLGRHSLKSASLLTEFRVGRCKADVAILNGTSSVYEIKSERDSLARLEEQISEYRNFFARVNVVVAESHLSGVMRIVPQDVGIYLLSDRFQLSTIRESVEDVSKLDLSTLFESLRIEESLKVLDMLGLKRPEVPNTLMYEAAKDIFLTQEKDSVHKAIVSVLKTNRSSVSLSELISNLPESLKPMLLTTHIRKKDHLRLLSAINTPVVEALKWN